ncbi:MAG TPA: zinc-binding dehydrogenase [Thermoplasmata archaeon]|nr:zinc-binding dehydrogenase [Thermoplasmata archaeon]
MNGLGFLEHGGLDRVRLVDIPEPVPGPGEIRVRVKAASFNHLDLFTLSGIPGVEIARPHVLGSDGAGIVDRRGEGAEGPEEGSRVLLNPGLWDGTCEDCRRGQESMCRKYRILGEHTQGTATELVVVPARNVHAIPSSMTFEEAAAAPLVFQTAWRALATIGRLTEGETCAIVGAGGGVATAAVQIAKRLGARVVVATRSGEKGERARKLGADEVVLFGPDAPLDRLLWAWSGKRGIDVILDSVGQPTVARSIQAIARGGRVVVIGATAGPKVEIDLRTVFWRQASLRGSTMAGQAEFRAVLAELERGAVRPVIDSTYPIDRGAEAIARLTASDLFGKVVVTVP